MSPQSLPGGQRSPSCFYGAVYILGRALCDRSKFFARRRVGGLKIDSGCRRLPVAVDEMTEAALVNLKPGQRLTRIFWRGTILHGHEFFDDAHRFLPAAFLIPRPLTPSDGDNPPNTVPSRGVRAGVQYPRACHSRQNAKAPLSSTTCPALLSRAPAIPPLASPFAFRPPVRTPPPFP